MAADAFGLYVHWPFCLAKCPYCDFNSHVAGGVDHDRWADAFVREIGRVGRMTGPRRLDTIFFGGGTPSLMDPSTVGRIIDSAGLTWGFADDIEITLEANPTSAEADRFSAFALAGVNRISIGVQALDDGDLLALGRQHTADEALRAVDLAMNCVERVSIDLIYARQGQGLEDWRAELSRALDIGTGHLSLYQLTIEDGTVFGRRHAAGRLPGLPDEDLSADLFELTQELTVAAGRPAYEVSNHAEPGARARHNLIYWNGGDFAGIGPGAHGRLSIGETRLATECPRSPAEWLSSVDSGRGDTASELTKNEILEERVLMGLRLADGMDADGLLATPTLRERTTRLIEDGVLWRSEDRVGVSPPHRLVLNSVIASLLT